jgi:hypothetical protein
MNKMVIDMNEIEIEIETETEAIAVLNDDGTDTFNKVKTGSEFREVGINILFR